MQKMQKMQKQVSKYTDSTTFEKGRFGALFCLNCLSRNASSILGKFYDK